MSRLIPRIGSWYQERASGLLFEIVAYDEDEATVQVQYLDGEIADYDLESWAEMSLARAAAPEDWRSAFELDPDDEFDADAAQHPLQWGSPLNGIEPDTVLGVEEY